MKLTSTLFFCANLSLTVILFAAGVVGQEKVAITLDLDNKLDADLSTEVKTAKPFTTPKYVETQNAKKSVPKSEKYVCPGKEVNRPFFALPCSIKKDCSLFGKNVLCCDKRCTQGVKPPKPEVVHSPTFFGIVQQTCPKEPIAEIWEIKKCNSDKDCEPRICCPETLKSGENISYCRTAQPVWDKIPAPKQFVEPFRALVGYMQCTPPPPPLLDLFPKTCETPLDCFPNLCCQEGGKKYCRPPKRSLLTLIAGIGQDNPYGCCKGVHQKDFINKKLMSIKIMI